ncbi:MAG: ATP-binding protein [Pseudomonadaceae bacterium]|nr:ATP-binding protein [Pseudomonadaceae bacterium]
MNKLSIKNVGPIGDGCGDAYIEINRLTVLLGPQGSGKSTIAKIYSSLAWLEKALVREEFTKEQYEAEDFFLKDVISYQGIQSYFNSKSYVHFIGKAYEFKLKNGKFSVVRLATDESFNMPKIMYVPAERNFLTAIPKPEYISGLPKPLHSFLSEFQDAKKWAAQQQQLFLPVGDIRYQYDKDRNKSFLLGNGFKTDLLHGSSGFQSLVPLFVVTEYLANMVLNKEDDPSRELYSLVQRNNIQDKMVKLIEQFREKRTDADVVALLPHKLKDIAESFKYKGFINIVEEPEQNLYPDSQKKLLFNLLKNLNKQLTNQLIITSHSPYILNFITLATQAAGLYKNSILNTKDQKKLKSIIPQDSAIDIESVNVYELDQLGGFKMLDKQDGYIQDSHKLNSAFDEINADLCAILDME